MKKCSLCKKEKPKKYFNKYSNSSDGLQTYCRSCQKIDKALRRYNLEICDYNELIKITNCQICNVELTSSVTPLATKRVIDHCHSSNIVRGVLCSHCNTGIGFLKEDINILNSAIEYILKFR